MTKRRELREGKPAGVGWRQSLLVCDRISPTGLRSLLPGRVLQSAGLDSAQPPWTGSVCCVLTVGVVSDVFFVVGTVLLIRFL